MNHLLYIIGEPGVGKSSLTAALVQGRRRRVYPRPFAHTVYEDGLVQLGRERALFSGTDTLSMSVSPVAIAALEAGTWSRVLAEGDRLAHRKFFEAAMAAGYRLDVVELRAPPEVAAARRAERGTKRDDKWVSGRAAKVAHLREFVTITLDATLPVGVLADGLALHPVLRGTPDAEPA